jgi:plasmid stabilization system protein ParE
MPPNVRVGSRAWDSVGKAAAYLAQHASLRTSRRFYQTFRHELERLAEFPEIGAIGNRHNPGFEAYVSGRYRDRFRSTFSFIVYVNV